MLGSINGNLALVEPAGDEPVRRPTVVETTATTIRARILDGQYVPGQRLIEGDLTRDLGVGRNAVREALSRLAAEGVVQLEPYRGALVTRPSLGEVEDLFAVRESLEALAAGLAAARIGLPGLGSQLDLLFRRWRAVTSTKTGVSTA